MHEHHACLRVKILAQALPDKELATECQQTAECSSNMRQEAAGHTCRRLFLQRHSPGASRARWSSLQLPPGAQLSSRC